MDAEEQERLDEFDPQYCTHCHQQTPRKLLHNGLCANCWETKAKDSTPPGADTSQEPPASGSERQSLNRPVSKAPIMAVLAVVLLIVVMLVVYNAGKHSTADSVAPSASSNPAASVAAPSGSAPAVVGGPSASAPGDSSAATSIRTPSASTPAVPGGPSASATPQLPPGDVALLTGAEFKDGSLVVGMSWPSTGSGDAWLFLVAVYGSTADNLDSFVSSLAGMIILGTSNFSITDTTGNAVFCVSGDVSPPNRPNSKTLMVPSALQGTGPVAIRIYANRDSQLFPVSNAIQLEYSAGGSY